MFKLFLRVLIFVIVSFYFPFYELKRRRWSFLGQVSSNQSTTSELKSPWTTNPSRSYRSTKEVGFRWTHKKGHDSIPASERIFYEITNLNKENLKKKLLNQDKKNKKKLFKAEQRWHIWRPLYIMRIEYEYIQTQCKEGARYVIFVLFGNIIFQCNNIWWKLMRYKIE